MKSISKYAALAIAAIGAYWMIGAPRTAFAQAAKTPAPAASDATKKADEPAAGPVWTADLSKAETPQKPAVGKIHGESFKLDRAEIQNGVLSLRQGSGFFADLEFKLFLFVNSPAQLENRALEIVDEENPPVKTIPHVYISWKPDANALPKTKSWTGDYVIKLRFGQIKGGKLAGDIYLCLPDMKQSFVAGTFDAVLK